MLEIYQTQTNSSQLILFTKLSAKALNKKRLRHHWLTLRNPPLSELSSFFLRFKPLVGGPKYGDLRIWEEGRKIEKEREKSKDLKIKENIESIRYRSWF